MHPTRPGEILDGRFKTIAKLGHGAGSTVWLAENLRFKRWRTSSVPRYVSVKIAALDTNSAWETRISKLVAKAQPAHEGLDFIRTPIDEFQIPSTEGLDYLHTKCGLIHTDIKDNNIMVTIESDDVLANFARSQEKKAQPSHVRPEDGRITYLSQSDFGPLQGTRLLPKLADFNLAFPGLAGDRGHLAAIQSHRFRAPEVMLGCPWSFSADICNLGLLMWNLLEDINLFERPAGEDGEYDAHVHLAQMVSLLGEPPAELIERERFFRSHQLERPVMNPRGKVCKTMNEFWGGPFFDADDHVFRKDLLGRKKLADTVKELAGDEKDTFLDFASGMLHWLPEKRKTAKELMKHPIFDSLNSRRAQWRTDE